MTNSNCIRCDGTGRCHGCAGTGYYERNGIRNNCYHCRGSGTCIFCEGTGTRKPKKSSAVKELLAFPLTILSILVLYAALLIAAWYLRELGIWLMDQPTEYIRGYRCRVGFEWGPCISTKSQLIFIGGIISWLVGWAGVLVLGGGGLLAISLALWTVISPIWARISNSEASTKQD
jgi:hypothetical protein